MVRNRSKKIAEVTVQAEEAPAVKGSSEPVKMVISDTAKPKATTSLVDRLNSFLSVLKELEQLVESTAPKDDKLMGSRFMKNRLRHQLEDLQRSLEKFVVQMEREA